MRVNAHNRLRRAENAQFCLHARSIVEVEGIGQMTNRQFELNHLLSTVLEVVTHQVLAIHLYVAIVLRNRLAEVNEHRSRGQTEVDCVVLVQLLDCIGDALEMKRDLKHGLG